VFNGGSLVDCAHAGVVCLSGAHCEATGLRVTGAAGATGLLASGGARVALREGEFQGVGFAMVVAEGAKLQVSRPPAPCSSPRSAGSCKIVRDGAR
jgi:hypothetical protein